MSKETAHRGFLGIVIEVSDSAYTEIKRALEEKEFDLKIEPSPSDGREVMYLDRVRIKAKPRPAL